MTARSFLILGGARSGKTRRGLALAETSTRPIYIATAEARDDEMAERIAKHQTERGDTWQTIEAPLHLTAAIRQADHPDAAILVDCLTLWLSNIMEHNHAIDLFTTELIAAIAETNAKLIFVTNEVGLGIVPDTPLGRHFRDAQGRLNQAIAAAVDRVELIVAGCSLVVKQPPLK